MSGTIFLDEDEGWKSVSHVETEYPGAYRVIPVEGGYMVFVYAADFDTWDGQR